tara:strand:+ start:935 stop:1198 length:264 start_codon:yes stop_codon:yes gene_type:complete
MWFWLISAIAGSILGNAVDSWFAETKAGVWFYKKVDQISTWATKKLNIKILADEEKWKKKYPNVAKKMTDLEQRVTHLENLHTNDLK